MIRVEGKFLFTELPQKESENYMEMRI